MRSSLIYPGFVSMSNDGKRGAQPTSKTLMHKMRPNCLVDVLDSANRLPVESVCHRRAELSIVGGGVKN